MTDYLTCGQCLREFPLHKITLFIQHKKLNCEDEPETASNQSELQCNYCPQGFMTAWGLLVHAQLTHNLKIFLEKASRSLLSKSQHVRQATLLPLVGTDTNIKSNVVSVTHRIPPAIASNVQNYIPGTVENYDGSKRAKDVVINDSSDAPTRPPLGKMGCNILVTSDMTSGERVISDGPIVSDVHTSAPALTTADVSVGTHTNMNNVFILPVINKLAMTRPAAPTAMIEKPATNGNTDSKIGILATTALTTVSPAQNATRSQPIGAANNVVQSLHVSNLTAKSTASSNFISDTSTAILLSKKPFVSPIKPTSSLTVSQELKQLGPSRTALTTLAAKSSSLGKPEGDLTKKLVLLPTTVDTDTAKKRLILSATSVSNVAQKRSLTVDKNSISTQPNIMVTSVKIPTNPLQVTLESNKSQSRVMEVKSCVADAEHEASGDGSEGIIGEDNSEMEVDNNSAHTDIVRCTFNNDKGSNANKNLAEGSDMGTEEECADQGCGVTVIPGSHEEMKNCCKTVVPKKRKRHMEQKHMPFSWGSSRYASRKLLYRSKACTAARNLASQYLSKSSASTIYIDVEPDTRSPDSKSTDSDSQPGTSFSVIQSVTPGPVSNSTAVSIQSGPHDKQKPRSLILQPGAVFSIPFTYTIPTSLSGQTSTGSSSDKSIKVSSDGTENRVRSRVGSSLTLSTSSSNQSQSHSAVKFASQFGTKEMIRTSILARKSSKSQVLQFNEEQSRGKSFNSKPFQCDKCSMTFNQRIHLKKHMSKHTGIKPYKCGECNYSTVERSHLKVHIRIHTGEKPFKCTYCEYATAQNSTLKIHLKRHHGGKMFHCTSCHKQFTEEQQLKEHANEHAGCTSPILQKVTSSSTAIVLPSTSAVSTNQELSIGHTVLSHDQPTSEPTNQETSTDHMTLSHDHQTNGDTEDLTNQEEETGHVTAQSQEVLPTDESM